MDKDKKIQKLEKKLEKWKKQFLDVQDIIKLATQELTSTKEENSSLRDKLKVVEAERLKAVNENKKANVGQKDSKIKQLELAITLLKKKASSSASSTNKSDTTKVLTEQLRKKDERIKELEAAVKVSALSKKRKVDGNQNQSTSQQKKNKPESREYAPKSPEEAPLLWRELVITLYRNLNQSRYWSKEKYAKLAKETAEEIFRHVKDPSCMKQDGRSHRASRTKNTSNLRDLSLKNLKREIVRLARLFDEHHTRLAFCSLLTLLGKKQRLGDAFTVDVLDMLIESLFSSRPKMHINIDDRNKTTGDTSGSDEFFAYENCISIASIVFLLLKRIEAPENIPSMKLWKLIFFPQTYEPNDQNHFIQKVNLTLNPLIFFDASADSPNSSIFHNELLHRALIMKGLDISNSWKDFAMKYPKLSKTLQFICVRRATVGLRDQDSCFHEANLWQEVLFQNSFLFEQGEVDTFVLDRDSTSQQGMLENASDIIMCLLDAIVVCKEATTCDRILSQNKEIIHCTTILARDMGWVWTHDVLICTHLWPKIADKNNSVRVCVIRLIGLLIHEANAYEFGSGCGTLQKYIQMQHVRNILERMTQLYRRLANETSARINSFFKEAVVSSTKVILTVVEQKISSDTVYHVSSKPILMDTEEGTSLDSIKLSASETIKSAKKTCQLASNLLKTLN